MNLKWGRRTAVRRERMKLEGGMKAKVRVSWLRSGNEGLEEWGEEEEDGRRDSMAVISWLKASYTCTDAGGKKQDTMVEDHGFRALVGDAMFGLAYNWPSQDYEVNPAPKDSSAERPTSVNSASFLKRDMPQEFLANTTDLEDSLSDAQEPSMEGTYASSGDSGYYFDDMDGNEVDGKECELIYDDCSGATMRLKNGGFVEVVTALSNPNAALTGIYAETLLSISSRPSLSVTETMPKPTGR
ncbi:MAG: Glycoside superfamily [Lasallia pustulata]|uniref:Glycoside superfamily n=1 Tax=Lasallia pustulata TaxID=136370 RepID=A0A5M8PW98_9LECA|nr:MAG: Glycoside superfamily [Lasallia pustulata]